MILVGTHNTKNKYTEQFKHLNKYTIKNNTQKFSNGQIVYEEPTDKSIKYIQQHAYTTHSIQGETARNNLYIVMSDMFDAKMIYTALSRAKLII
jgi:ATP-dependent exoDNAse (exonuclease V) alpha subunit